MTQKKIRNPKTTQKQLDPLLKNIEKILGILSIEEIVYITNKESKDYLFENTFCGKGILSKSQPRLPYEPLQLSPFEAFYLISELKKLQVVYEETNEIVPSQTLWDLFSQQNQNFSAKYGAYRYFRKKGWVPKSGLKFASDFVIYQKGPSYFHAK
ncbi:tRNA-splicing endonuclease subunit sen2 [Anaeramoeba flamelloides]|uniref:tRNA-intron lyase n=1 Tax=Anaeramoeba flamelloides TaxID=1746091 RepID=A0AAV7ZEA1_9EUKA|nr:tRNA-splicing endonuclease subunit sen2 [Anaeramoeba flamelloides]KAJ6227604.1 tRNA-splicing endonuclease subunit sen2 [Anaeramoeba flamelloides]